MSDYEQAVFISYAWGGEREEVVNQIDRALQAREIRIIRDKRELGYKGSISEFMERIGRGNCVIVVISDKYLRSPSCMFELVEIAEGKQFHDRIFPVVLNDANIYDPIKQIEYIKYWEVKRTELAEAIKTLDPANLQGIREKMDLYDRIRDKVSGITSTLSDMNTLTPEMHRDSDFNEMFNAIEKRLKEYQSKAGISTTESAQNEGARLSGASAGLTAQNFNVSGGAFSGPVQFGHMTQNIGTVQNVYYANPIPEPPSSPYLKENIEVEFFEPETILIPEGHFWMGRDPGQGVPVYDTPRHELHLPVYRISRYPVLNRQYEEFISQTGKNVYPVMGWSGRRPREDHELEPVTGITWDDAREYCKWLSEQTKRKYDLPNEAQLEKAYQADYGCSDIFEDIYLWTCTLWGEDPNPPDAKYLYPWQKDDGRNNPNANSQIRRVVCRYKKVAGEERCQRVSRTGQFPRKPSLPERYSFRVVMSVQN